MSILSVSTITTKDGVTNQTLTTGNTSSGKIVVPATGGLVLSSNATTNAVTIDTSGNIGIGTGSPAYNFHLKNSSGNAYLAAQYGTGTIGYMVAASNEVQLRAFNGTNDVITFATGASERMRIDTSGNVGIGTSSPGYVLDVNKNSATNSIRIGSYQDTSKQWLLDNTNGGFTINGSGALSSTFMVNVSGSERMRIDSSGNLLFNSGYGSAATAYGCRAWVTFVGSTVAINGSGNVTSVTRNGAGDYTINFVTSMPDINYEVSGSGSPTGTGFCVFTAHRNGSNGATVAPTTGAVRINTCNVSQTATDVSYVNVMVIR